MKKIVVQGTAAARLDVALAKELAVSRAEAQRMIKDGRVTVDGTAAKAHAQVAPGATLGIAPSSKPPRAKDPLPKLDILFENDDVLVVNKPNGLLVHPTHASTEPTLLDAAVAHFPAIKKVGDDASRSGIVHRLDKEASGVLIVAKTNKAFKFLKEEFKGRRVEKHYTVLVQGTVRDDHGTIDFPIARSNSRARMAARPKSQEGKDAITHFEVIKRFTTSTLLDVKIETGRTHQIRAHFFALGHSVVGDPLYRQRGKAVPSPRLFLHARELTLTLPDGDRKTFTSPLPPEMERFLTSLKPLVIKLKSKEADR